MTKLFESNWNAYREALLEGLDGDKKRTTAKLLDNTVGDLQANSNGLLAEAASAGSTAAGNVATLNKVILPIIRRVMPTVIANEIIGVQPMSGPVGQIRTLRVRYADTVGNIAAGTEALSPFDLGGYYSGNENVNKPGAAQTSELEGTGGNKISIQILKEIVQAKTHKLSATWTFEAAQDAQSQDGLDIEAEIMAALAQEITVEIDQNILGSLGRLAGAPSAVFEQGKNSALRPTFVGDQHAALALLINQQANIIARNTRRGAANWAVVSQNALTILQSATTSAFARTTEATLEAPTNTKFAGTLNNAMKVYVNAYAADNTPVLIGYKGDNQIDSGSYYCPYIPISSSGVIMNPETFQPTVSFMTRFGYVELTNRANSLGNGSDYYANIGIDTASLSFQ